MSSVPHHSVDKCLFLPNHEMSVCVYENIRIISPFQLDAHRQSHNHTIRTTNNIITYERNIWEELPKKNIKQPINHPVQLFTATINYTKYTFEYTKRIYRWQTNKTRSSQYGPEEAHKKCGQCFFFFCTFAHLLLFA